MNTAASLLGLTVRDYFDSCNWQLLPPPSCNYLPKQTKIVSPKGPIVLSALSVKEFFDSCNWQLLPPNELDNDSTSLLPPQVTSDFQKPPTVLPCLTVTEFFSLCNWHSLPLEVRTQPLPLEQESPLKQESPLTWQVQAFFHRIPWEGNAEIGKLTEVSTLSELISPGAGMNLNDLSNLF